MSYKKIISVILSILIILHPFSLYADDIATSSAQTDNSPTQAEETTPTPTPMDSEHEASDEAALDPSPIATESADITDQTINTGESNEQTSTDSAQINQATENTNTADVNNTVNSESSTGENTTENNILSEIDTGDASASADVITLANNNVIGNDIHQDVINLTQDNSGDINLTNKPACSDMSEGAKNDFLGLNTGDNSAAIKDYKKALYETIYNSNKARIINNITLIAVTGENKSEDIINSIETGDANILLNIFNMVNTNLIGNCGYFGIINVYGNQTGDIILPYELGYLGVESLEGETSQNGIVNSGDNFFNGSNSVNSSSSSVSNSNDASVQNNIESDAGTGGNSATGYAQIQSGSAISNIRLADTVNTNITGDRWVLVLVNYYGTWDGEVEGWSGNVEEKPQSVLMWVRLPSGNSPASLSQNQVQNTGDESSAQSNLDVSSDQSVQNNNDAAVENNIKLVADTGNNSAEGRLSSIKTGDASITLNEATLANTNIVGNNWFFAIINIFGNFVGNVVFPRPDVAIKKSADKTEAAPGEDIMYTIAYANLGRYKAVNTKVNDILPSNSQLQSYTAGATVANNSISWSIGTLAPGQSGTLTVIVKVSDTQNSVVNTASISTTTDEPKKNNNSSSVVTQIRKIGGSALQMSSQNNVDEKEVISESVTSTIYYEPQNNQVTKVEVESLLVQKNSESEKKTKTAVLAAQDQAKPTKGRNICRSNIIVCAGAGISIIPTVYVLLKRKKLFHWFALKSLLRI